ncbi:hypothetical protein MPLDJ20_100097 [Mesorhizobium plurifarium]|uniref:Uncharacterized protein n=1 Tax=Mesorhizobium plurifarium TaxID=69974 RepID=A0A090DKZ0_MESPL|nr:hypothetical protein MPLDJ20_100097 [Mesorhizobium plurifarium]
MKHLIAIVHRFYLSPSFPTLAPFRAQMVSEPPPDRFDRAQACRPVLCQSRHLSQRSIRWRLRS